MHAPRFADERYAAQRLAGFSGLRFEPDLELEYRATYIPNNATRLRLAHAISILSVLLFLVLDSLAFRLTPPLAVKILLGATIPALILPILATYMHNPGATVQRYVFYCSLVVGVSLVAAVEIARLSTGWFPYEALLLALMYTYLVSGLLFMQAAAVGWIVAAAFVVFELTPHVLRPTLAYEVFYLVVGNLIGMIGVYMVQYESRRNFLLQNELWLRAVLDPLTGVLNRREFRNQLDTAWALAQRQQVPLGLLLVDVDNFKAINDSRGHPAGDQVLRAVGDVLKDCAMRPMDAVGRYGGDEFVAMWFDVDPAWFHNLAQELPARLAAYPMAGTAAGVKLNVSGGAVLVEPRPGVLPQDAINLADLKLYERKRDGRGTVALAVFEPATA